jgi:uncharacterized protein
VLFVNYCTYVEDPAEVAAVRPKHREYIAKLSAEGKIVGAGPLADGTGGLFIYSVRDEEEARKLADEDPYSTMGVLTTAVLSVWKPANTSPELLVTE